MPFDTQARNAVWTVTGKRAWPGVDPVAEAANPQLRTDIAFRVIADHARCLTFALTDGAVPRSCTKPRIA